MYRLSKKALTNKGSSKLLVDKTYTAQKINFFINVHLSSVNVTKSAGFLVQGTSYESSVYVLCPRGNHFQNKSCAPLRFLFLAHRTTQEKY